MEKAAARHHGDKHTNAQDEPDGASSSTGE
jgi:hypothetical protein